VDIIVVLLLIAVLWVLSTIGCHVEDGFKILGEIMNSVEDIKTELESVGGVVDNIEGDILSLQAQVEALKEQLGNGGVVTQEDLDAIFLSVQNLKSRLTSVDAKEPVPEEPTPVE